MSEYKSKRTTPAKPFKKQTGGYKGKTSSTFGKKDKPRVFSDDLDTMDSRPKKRYDKTKSTEKPLKSDKRSSDLVPKINKRFDKTKSTEKPLKSDKRSSDLVPRIKKRFNDFGKDSNLKTPDKKTIRPYSRSKQSNSEGKGSDEKSPKIAPKYGEKKNYKRDKPFEKKPFKKKYIKSASPKKRSESDEFEGSFRLNRYIAASGICSRREADDLIKLGEVKLNGVVVTEMGVKVNPTDKVEVGGQSITPERKVYILLNKPKDFVSTVSDPHADRTVMDLVKLAGPERVYPVGRLDKNTTGVMLLTNDGDLTKKLTHPSYKKKKIYHVVLDKPATKANLQQIIEGFELEDGYINADAVSFVKEGDKTEIGIEIHSGRNRIVRRIFEYLGFDVVKLDRVYFAGLTKKNVPRGKWRYLDEKEIGMLKRGAYE